jgi:Retinal pigment epithelial membrane protein
MSVDAGTVRLGKLWDAEAVPPSCQIAGQPGSPLDTCGHSTLTDLRPSFPSSPRGGSSTFGAGCRGPLDRQIGAVRAASASSPTSRICEGGQEVLAYASAYEDGDRIVVDYPGLSAPVIVLPPEERRHITSGFRRATIDPGRATMSVDRIDDVGSEFPRIDDRLTGRRHRYLTVASRSGRAALQPAEHDRLCRYDMQAGTSTHADTNAAVGEVCFAPRAGGTDELDGYYLAYGADVDRGVSSLYIWDASTFPADPSPRSRCHGVSRTACTGIGSPRPERVPGR